MYSQKFCSSCERRVPNSTKIGDKCPHCFVRFGMKGVTKTVPRGAIIDDLKKDLKSPNPSTRKEAANKLGRLKANTAVVGLGDALKDDRSSVRTAAKKALKRIANDGSNLAISYINKYEIELAGKNIQNLKKLLKHQESEVREAAARILNEIGSDEAIE